MWRFLKSKAEYRKTLMRLIPTVHITQIDTLLLLYTRSDKVFENFSHECHKMWFGCVGDKASQEKELEKTSCETANSETASTSETTTPETTTSETRSQPLLPTPGTSTQSQSGNSKSHFEKTSDQVQIAEIYKQFPDATPSKLHHYLLCTQKQCSDISREEHNRIKVERNREKFHHSWLGNKSISFCLQTAMFWLVYIEGEGFYCLLCKKHQTANAQNKEVKFTMEPSVRIKEQSLKSHVECSAHQRAVSGELLNRVVLSVSNRLCSRS